MAYLFRFRIVFGLVLFGLGVAFWGFGKASAQSDAEQISILSGFETSAADRTRTIIRTRLRGDRLVVDKWRVPLGTDRELEGGQNGARQASSRRAATGRSAETLQNGVRVINSRSATRNVVRLR